MLENKNIQIRPDKNAKYLRIFFLVFTIGLAIILALFIPDLYKFLISDEEEITVIFRIDEYYMVRSLVGLFLGIIISIIGLKLYSTNILVQFIRIFFLTFIILAAFLYIAFKGAL